MAQSAPTLRVRLARAAVLLFSGSVAALLVLQAGVPGCSANTPAPNPLPASKAGPVITAEDAPPQAQPAAPQPAPPQPAAPPIADVPANTANANPADPPPASNVADPPAKTVAPKKPPNNPPNNLPNNPPLHLPASKAGAVFLPPPQQQAAQTPQQRAP
jgi:hypothetical protein